jgi:hypothetical protein
MKTTPMNMSLTGHQPWCTQKENLEGNAVRKNMPAKKHISVNESRYVANCPWQVSELHSVYWMASLPPLQSACESPSQ